VGCKYGCGIIKRIAPAKVRCPDGWEARRENALSKVLTGRPGKIQEPQQYSITRNQALLEVNRENKQHGEIRGPCSNQITFFHHRSDPPGSTIKSKGNCSNQIMFFNRSDLSGPIIENTGNLQQPT
jgi:hypothetical protein